MIHICEVGPRDGLQNEPKMVTTEEKVALIQKLIDAGIKKLKQSHSSILKSFLKWRMRKT